MKIINDFIIYTHYLFEIRRLFFQKYIYFLEIDMLLAPLLMYIYNYFFFREKKEKFFIKMKKKLQVEDKLAKNPSCHY